MKDILDWLACQCVYFTLRTSHSTNSAFQSHRRNYLFSGTINGWRSEIRHHTYSATMSAFTTLLCGDTLLKNVLLVTTKWGEVEPAIGEKREEDLKNISLEGDDANIFAILRERILPIPITEAMNWTHVAFTVLQSPRNPWRSLR